MTGVSMKNPDGRAQGRSLGLRRRDCYNRAVYLKGGCLPRVDSVRVELQRMIRSVPFRKFVLSLENGERVLIEHPENVAFDPEPNGVEDVSIVSRQLRLYTTLSTVSGLYLADTGGAAA